MGIFCYTYLTIFNIPKMKYRLIPTSERDIRHILGMPFIYGVAIVVVMLDVGLEIYHRVCFPLYRIPYVERSKYIRIDRHKLSYLDPLQKLNCMYCGYANGLFAYGTQIVAETEKYWCAIQHEEVMGFEAPEHHKDFPKYGDEAGFRKNERTLY